MYFQRKHAPSSSSEEADSSMMSPQLADGSSEKKKKKKKKKAKEEPSEAGDASMIEEVSVRLSGLGGSVRTGLKSTWI